MSLRDVLLRDVIVWGSKSTPCTDVDLSRTMFRSALIQFCGRSANKTRRVFVDLKVPVCFGVFLNIPAGGPETSLCFYETF